MSESLMDCQQHDCDRIAKWKCIITRELDDEGPETLYMCNSHKDCVLEPEHSTGDEVIRVEFFKVE